VLGCFQGLDFHCVTTAHGSIDNGDIRMAKPSLLIQVFPNGREGQPRLADMQELNVFT
jgi:hypothetical protein